MSEDNSYVRLEKIQGGVDLINERLKHANELQNERHAAVLLEISGLHATDALIDGRVGALETKNDIMAGQRQGIALSGRILWAGIGLIGGLAVTVAKMIFGV